jgi:hypothetical protein
VDTETAAAIDPGAAGEGHYLRRAQALLAARSELFPATSARLTGMPGPPQDRPVARFRRNTRQLTLPLPRENARRRARMMR